MQTLHYDHHGATRVVTLTFDDPAAPVNTMGEAWLADLHEAVDRLVAQKEHIAGVILASPFDSLVAVGRQHYPWLPVSLLLRHRFDAASLARKIDAPMLAINRKLGYTRVAVGHGWTRDRTPSVHS